MKDEIKIVIGSWGSYTACNERALGSSYFTLSRYEDWEEIVKELKRQGFELSASTKNSLSRTSKVSPSTVKTGTI